MTSQQPPPDHLDHSGNSSGRPYYAEKALPPPAPSLDQRSSLLHDINPGLYHKMGVQTVCPSCGLIEPYRHGQYTGALVWHDYSYLRVVCYDQWGRDHIPPEIGPATLIRLDQGAEPQPPYQPRHAAGPHETFIEALLNHHPVTEIKRQTPEEIEAAIMQSRKARAQDRQHNDYNLDEAALARITLQENKYIPLADRPKKTRLC
jgi:hypothetical protein